MAKKPLYNLLFEDDNIIIINKAPGIPVIQERDPSTHIFLQNEIKKKSDSEVLIVHRIDKDTSGIVMFAKNTESQRLLSQQFEEGKVYKKYLALVEGRVDEAEWQTIDQPIFKKSNAIKVFIHKDGKRSITKYRTLELFKNSSLLEIELVTGRTHQIRVHFAHLQHPLLVDKMYGNREEFFLSEILKRKYKISDRSAERAIMQRHSLHASEISFNHPISGEKIFFEAPVPKDWKALVNQLRKNS